MNVWQPSFALGRLTLVGFATVALATGCHSASPATPARPVAFRTTASASASSERVQSAALYHQAQQACRRKDFRSAATLLDRLARTPGYTAEETAFCKQQRDICLQDAGRPVSVAPLPLSPPLNSARSADCGPRALRLACQKLGVNVSLEKLRVTAGTTEQGTSLEGLAKAARAVGLKAEGVQMSREALAGLDTVAVAWVNRDHFVAVLSVAGRGEKATAAIHDPNHPTEETLPQEKLLQLCGGYLLLLQK